MFTLKHFLILDLTTDIAQFWTTVKRNFLFRRIFNRQSFSLFTDSRIRANGYRDEPRPSDKLFGYISFSSYNRPFEFSFLFKFFSKLHLFKSRLLSSLALDQSWAGLSHMFWLKTRVSYFMNNWIYTTNHKRIAVNYFWFVILSGIVGMVLATLIRLEFAYPGAGVFVGDSLQYLSLATAHGVIMVFFMIMPLLFGAFANFLLPTQLGVHDVAFPRLNSAAFWFLPGGLLMLCQLVCVDKRYQRMNCFNIREIQAILKKNFFSNLINSHDRRDLLDKTAIGLRFKTSSTNAILSNAQIFFNFGTNYSSKGKSQIFSSVESDALRPFLSFYSSSLPISVLQNSQNITLLNLLSIFNALLLKVLNLFYNLFSFAASPFFFANTAISKISLNVSIFFFFVFNALQITALNISLILNFVMQNLTSILNFTVFFKEFLNLLKNSTPNFNAPVNNGNERFFFVIEQLFFAFFKFFFSIFTCFFFWINLFISNLKLYFYAETINFDRKSPLNFIFGNTTNALHNYFLEIFCAQINYFSIIPSKVSLKSKTEDFTVTKLPDLTSFAHIDNSNTFRELKFFNPSLKYNYKSGDYFPKFSKETYTYLFSVLTDLTSIGKLTMWFQSGAYLELLNNNIIFFFNFTESSSRESLSSKQWTSFIFNPSDGFYNFFFELALNSSFFNLQYVSTPNIQQKFHKMFHTNSFQQRILANWRQLKFTREAWRCKLLSARHQKTLFRRYTHEDGVFWSIERNAKDLLPGWAMITPFSSRTRFTAVGKTDIGLMGVLLVLNSSIISAANFLVTYRYLSTLNNRKMRDARAFFTEGVMVSSWMMVTANPMLVIGIIMLLSDRHWQTSFFDYSGGGDTVLFQHMFWFFGHPEVYIIIIPTFGFTNTMLSFYFRKRVSARASLLYSMYTIAFLGFFVWGHHMYMVGLAHTTRMLFSTLTVMISVPAATKIMHWCVTFVNSSFATELPLLFILTFIFFFVSGGISGMCVAHTGMDVLFHDTFYVIGHFHVMLAGAAMFASFGAFYFYFPAIFGVKYSRLYAYLHYTYYLIGQLMTVIPMFWLGYAGMPRRVLDYPASMGGWHSVISAGHMLSVAGLMSFFIMIFDSLRQGRAVVRNTFGVSRYNTRLNFYLFAVGHHIYAQQKGLFLFKFTKPGALKLNAVNYKNYEPLETTLLSYNFYSKL